MKRNCLLVYKKKEYYLKILYFSLRYKSILSSRPITVQIYYFIYYIKNI